MKTDNGRGGWARALAVGALVWGFTAMAQTPPPTVWVSTVAVQGAANDTVVASAADVGVRTGATLTVTLRLVTERGAVLAEVTGPVTEGSPLRVSARAPTSLGVRAELVLPYSPLPLSAGVLVLERWEPLDKLRIPPVVCPFPWWRTNDDETGMEETTTSLKCLVRRR